MGHKEVTGGPVPHGPASATHRSGSPAGDPGHEPESHGAGNAPESAEGNQETLWVDLGGEG
jgi:hypothetical protein